MGFFAIKIAVYDNYSVVKNVKKIAMSQKYNAIPRECNASILVPEEAASLVEKIISEQSDIFKGEYP